MGNLSKPVRKLKASVTASALVAVSLLFILSVSLVQVAQLFVLDEEREREKTRAGWFLEGRLHENLDGLLTGSEPLREGRTEMTARDGDREQFFATETTRDSGGSGFVLRLSALWKDRFPAARKAVFSTIDPFRYVLFFNGDASRAGPGRTLVQGGLAFRKTAAGEFALRRPPSAAAAVETAEGNAAPQIRLFTNDIAEESSLFGNTKIAFAPAGRAEVRANPLLRGLEFPGPDMVWNAFRNLTDPSWELKSAAYFPRLTVLNPLDPEKEFVSAGNGVTGRFRARGRKVGRIYVRDLNQGGVMGPEYATAYGAGMPFMTAAAGEIEIPGVSGAVPLSLPEEAFEEWGTIRLSGSGWSALSRDQSLSEIYINEVSPYQKLREGPDYLYDREDKKIKIRSAAFFRDQTVLLGRGDGRRKSFPADSFGLYSGRGNMIFSGGRRAASVTWSEGGVHFSAPPKPGDEIVCLKIPRIHIRVAPPGRSQGVYVDRNDESAVLDLGRIRNFPRWGVIRSGVPLVVRGTVPRPMVILSRENVYLQDINRDGGGAPLLVWSAKGVWIYQDAGSDGTVLNKCLIQSPLPAVWVLREGGVNPGPVRILGGAVLTFARDLKKPVDSAQPDMEIVRPASVSNWTVVAPLSAFPRPFVIREVRRE